MYLNAPMTDRLVSRADLCQTLSVGQEAIRRWIKSGKLPKPDVALSRKTLMWKLSTLHAAGIGII